MATAEPKACDFDNTRSIQLCVSYKEKLVMTIKKDMLKGTALGLVLGFSGAILAQAPVVNISKKHGNLRDAQEAIVQAYQKSTKPKLRTRTSQAVTRRERRTFSPRRTSSSTSPQMSRMRKADRAFSPVV